MDAIMQALMGGDALTDDDKMQQVANQLRQSDNAAQIFSMSTIAPIANAAKKQRGIIQDAALRGGRARQLGLERARERQQEKDRLAREAADRKAKIAREDAIRLENQKREDAQRLQEHGWDVNKATKDRQSKLDIAQGKLDAKGNSSTSGLKPTGKERTDYREAKRLIGILDSLEDVRSKMTPKDLDILDQPIKNAAIQYLPDDFQRIAEEKVYNSPIVRTYQTKLSNFESRVSQLASGLAVTGYEMSDRKKWSPGAEGISDAERQRRIQNIRDDFGGRAEGYEKFYPDYTYDSISNREQSGQTLDTSSSGIPESAVAAGVTQEMWDDSSEDQKEYWRNR